MADSLASADRQIARATAVVMLGMALSSLAGLAATILVSRAFGASAELDAFYAANRISEMLFNLMAGGALASAFVPTFTGLLTQGERERAWRLASSIANLVFLALLTLAGLAWVAAPWLVENVLAPGFRDAEQIHLTVSLLRTLLISALIFGQSGLLMGVLNAQGHFALPALAPAAYRLGWILGATLLAPKMGISGLAWGVVLGSLLHLLVQLPALRGRNARYQASMNLGDPSVRLVGKLIAPRFLGVAVVQLNFLVNTILASGQPEGSLSAISIAFQVMIMPQAVIAQAAAIAALPTFSAQAARGDMSGIRASLVNTLRAVFFLAFPATIGLILLRQPIVMLLLQRGAFDQRATGLVAWALLWYAVGLVGHSLLEIVARAFYALKDTRTPVLVGSGAMGANVLLSLSFSWYFPQIGWAPHGGLALANSTATALECCILLILLRRKLGGLDEPGLRRGILATVLAGGVLAVVTWGWLAARPTPSLGLLVLGGVTLGAGAYWLAAWAFGAPEARQLPAAWFRRSPG